MCIEPLNALLVLLAASALLDVDPRTDERWLERLADDPMLLRTPLVRCQQRVTVGPAESTWKEWVDA